jgi:Sodium/hydrogen exchanger family
VHVSVMLAGFAFGLALSAIGTPRRLASQLFAVTEGFLGPLFFIWLGASIDLRELAHHPRLVLLAVGLAAGTSVIHALARLLGQPLPLAVLATAQLGVPVAAVALGTGNKLLAPGEGGAILGAAVITLGVAAVAGAAARKTSTGHAAAPAATAGESPSPTTPARPTTPTTPSAPSATSALPPPREPAVTPTPPPAPPDRGAATAPPAAPARPAPVRSRKPKQAPPREPTVHVRRTSPTAPDAYADPEPADYADSSATRPPAKRPQQLRPPTPNPATKPIVQSNVRIQPSPRAHRTDDDG